MLEVPVYNTAGQQVETMQIEESVFGSQVNTQLLKQAVVAYHANRRQGTARNKSRGEIIATGKKMYRQKGTGNARHGAATVNLMRGGGNAFAKRPRDIRQRMPRKMRIAALKSAILAKIQGEDLCILDGLKVDEPKTKALAEVMDNLKINRRCLLATAERDHNVYLSSRNLPDLTVRTAEELNAFDIATRQKMIVTREAMAMLTGQAVAEEA